MDTEVVDKELIINSSPTGIEIALLEDNKLVEIHREKSNKKFSVGDIFLGYVQKTRPGLNAAFVDIGHQKEAFLHYTDLGPPLRSLLKFTNGAIAGSLQTELLDRFEMEPHIIKTGKIDDVLPKRTPIVAQIVKEPISTKGPRLSCEITLPGRYLVLCPFADGLNISKKISNADEVQRLKLLLESIRPKGFGIIARTAAEGKGVADLHEEMESLLAKWRKIYDELRGAQKPKKLLNEINKTNSILREILDDSFNRIMVNDRQMAQDVRDYLGMIAPSKVKIVKEFNQKLPIFEKTGVTRQIKSSFGKTYTMPSGAYLVIESTEAMHVIDVNSGPKALKINPKDGPLKVNLEAAVEIARQLRLRDIGGLIVVDFIDMKSADHNKVLLQTMRKEMAEDRARHTILPLSRFGLMEITRERVKPAVEISTSEVCPTCNGSGKSTASILIIDDIERDLKHLLNTRPKSKLKLEVHPFIYAYLTKGLISKVRRWFFDTGKMIKVIPNMDLGMLDYRFYDSFDEEIKLG